MATAAAGILALFSVPLRLSNPTALGDTLRHLTMGRLLAERGSNAVQGWGDFLHAGYFSGNNIDPWWLVHRLLIPTARLPIEQAQEVFIGVLIAMVTTSFLRALRHLKVSTVRASILTLLLLLGHVQFSMRLLLGRPVFLMVAIVVLTLLAVLKRNWIAAGLLLLIATLISHLFVFPLFIAGIGCLWLLALGERKNAIAMGSASLTGVVLGFAIHPNHFQYLSYVATVFLQLPFFKSLDMSTEMHTGIGRMAAVFGVLGLITLLLVVAGKKGMPFKEFHQRGISFLLAIVLTFTAGMLLWVRMIDFLWPLLLILLAAVMQLKSGLLAETAGQLLPRAILKPSLLLSVLAIILIGNTAKLHFAFGSGDSSRDLNAFSIPLEGIPEGSRILNVDWDLFPVLFSVRPDLLYARGLDPGFDALTDKRSIELLNAVRSGPNDADWDAWLAGVLEIYPADYVVTRRTSNPPLVSSLRSIARLALIGHQGNIVVFRVSAPGT